MSVVVTEEMAERAIKLARPSIEAMMEDGIAKRTDGYLVVGWLKPHVPLPPNVLSSLAFGDPAGWEHDYAAIAARKYNITDEYRLSTRDVHDWYPEDVPHLPTPYKGSAFNKEYGLIVAYSGADEHVDEGIADMVMGAFLAIVRGVEKSQKESPEAVSVVTD